MVEFGSMKKDCHVVAKRIAILVERFDKVGNGVEEEEHRGNSPL